MITLRDLWNVTNVPLFDMSAPGFYAYARLEAFDKDFNKIPGYMPFTVVLQYGDAEVEEVSWHNCGISVKFYKGDEDEEGIE